MISKFFIDRPIFASVLSIVITLAGAIAYTQLPISQYPPITPPVVSVDCNFPGASAQVVSETVAAPIEQYVNGVENMLYMSSQCTNDGSYNLQVTFKNGVDLNVAQVMVQNRVALAVPLLPDVLKQTGVAVKKRSPDILLAIAINSPDESRDQLFLSNYAQLQLQPELARVYGVSDVLVLGQRDYSMRIWVDPDRLASLNLGADDIVQAIREQNAPVATGQIGQQPAPYGQDMQITVSTLGRLLTPKQFENIIVKTGAEGRIVRLKDVARVEIGAKSMDVSCQVNGKPSVSLAIFQLPDANAFTTAQLVKDKVKELSARFPTGVFYEIRYDTTPFIMESIEKVYETLFEAVLLVAVVVLLFLQNWRSALIPLIAVPVAIIGTFAVMAALGFSLNNLTLFGLVLAIGIVVDDAIVVVEAVEHHIEHGLAPRDATIRAMEEVSGPVIAIGLVLSAVFIPCAFITGIVGQFFKQFALTIATSTIISAFNSLTLSPALAAVLIKPKSEKPKEALPTFSYALIGGFAAYMWLGPVARLAMGKMGYADSLARFDARFGVEDLAAPLAAALVAAPIAVLLAKVFDRLLGALFRLFNSAFRLATRGYGMTVGLLLRASILIIAGYIGLLYLTYKDFVATPSGFIPTQDMGYLLTNVQSPDAMSAELTWKAIAHLEEIAKDTPGVRFTQVVGGQSLLLSAYGSNFGSMFAVLHPFKDREFPEFFLKPLRRDLLMRLKKELPDVVSGIDEKTIGDEALKVELARLLSKSAAGGGPKGALGRIRAWLGLASPKPQADALAATRPEAGSSRAVVEEYLAAHPDPPKLRIEDVPGLNRLVGNYDFLTKLTGSVTGDAIADELRKRFGDEVPDCIATVFGPPPVRGVGRAGGWKILIEDRGDNGPIKLQQETEALVAASNVLPAVPLAVTEPKAGADSIINPSPAETAAARAALAAPLASAKKPQPEPAPKREKKAEPDQPAPWPKAFVGVFTVFRANVPQLYADVDRTAAMTSRVDLQELASTLQVYLGSLYVNDINLFGRTWQVIVQADADHRRRISDVRRLKVRNEAGAMVPIGSLAQVREEPGPLVLTRYNMYPAAPINGNAGPGVSSGDAIKLLEELTRSGLHIGEKDKYGRQATDYLGLPDSMTFEWTELAYLELQAGDTAILVFGFAVVAVFLVLAAQYESWSLPLAVILVVPLCLLSSVIGVRYVGQDINIFTKIGFVVLVGLASKNAILIVEFAKARREAGETIRDATLEACALRLRPIVMTSSAFILGVIPLLTSYGAGAEMRKTLGVTVFSGMLGVTIFGVFLTPVFFYVIETISESRIFRIPAVRYVAQGLLLIATAGVSGLHMLAGRARGARRPPAKPTPEEPIEEFADNP